MVQSKKCTVCKETKPSGNFNKYSKSKDGLQWACRECSSKLNKRHYQANKPALLKKKRACSNKRRLRNKLIVYNYLSNNSCIDCGEDDIMVLEFDHVRSTKDNGITTMVQSGLAVKTLMREIEKCEVRCANCHRKKTYFDLGWDKMHTKVHLLLKQCVNGEFANVIDLIGDKFALQIKETL